MSDKVYGMIKRDTIRGEASYVIWTKKPSEFRRWPIWHRRFKSLAEARDYAKVHDITLVKRWYDAYVSAEMCRYFALCDREAVGTLVNPVIGLVPTCQRCADKVGAGHRLVKYG